MSHRRQLRMGAININSNRSACYDSKVQHADFTDLTNDLDVIGITETHSSMESDVQKQGYKHFAVVRKKAPLARAHSGGIAVLVRNSLAPHTSMCEWSNPCCLTVRINGSALDLSQDLYIVTVYVPPENSSYLKSTGINPFDLLLQTQHHIPPLSHVVWMGDFNAHLDQENSSSPHVPSELLPALNFNLPSADPPARTSLDTRKVDSYGRKLLQFCGDRDLTILNGCTPGDSQGYFTYEKGPVRSVIDYAIVSQSIWPLVRNFLVDQHNPVLTDHSLIRLELNLAGSKYITHPRAEGQSPLLKFDWSPEATERLHLRFSSPQFLLQIQLLEARLSLPAPDIDRIVSDLSNLLLDNTKQVNEVPHPANKNLVGSGMTPPYDH